MKAREPARARPRLPAPSVRSPAGMPRVADPGDQHEQEADRITARVMAHGGRSAMGTCPCGGGCPKCGSASKPSGFGQRLDPATRADMEPRFGRGFSSVRVHTGPAAARASAALGARAFTLGSDVVFGTGEYAPHTYAGRELLAHELAHVTQQERGDVSPRIQRRLIATGKPKDIDAMLQLLQSASGLTLRYDPKKRQVVATGSVRSPRSAVLALRLEAIINDEKRDAEIQLGRYQPGVSFGAFPTDLENGDLVQRINIDHILALEGGAPGNGIAKLAHEIVENHRGHDPVLKDFRFEDAFSVAHGDALEVEDLVAAELVGPGGRRNTFSVMMGKAPARSMRTIEDVGNYFLVWETPFDRGGTAIANARRVPRVKVSRYVIDGFVAGSRAVPAGGRSTIATLAADLRKHPTASARAEGFASVGPTPKESTDSATIWAELVQDAVVASVGDVMVASSRRFHLEGNADRSANRVVITLERPDT